MTEIYFFLSVSHHSSCGAENKAAVYSKSDLSEGETPSEGVLTEFFHFLFLTFSLLLVLTAVFTSTLIDWLKIFCLFVQQGAQGEQGDAGVPGKPGPKGLQGQTVGPQISY